MNSGKLKRLKAAGWKVGTTRDFLGLQEQEAALVEVKLAALESGSLHAGSVDGAPLLARALPYALPTEPA